MSKSVILATTEKDQQTMIQELEMLALLVAVSAWCPGRAGRRIVAFTDSESVRGSFLKTWSSNDPCSKADISPRNPFVSCLVGKRPKPVKSVTPPLWKPSDSVEWSMQDSDRCNKDLEPRGHPHGVSTPQVAWSQDFVPQSEKVSHGSPC